MNEYIPQSKRSIVAWSSCNVIILDDDISNFQFIEFTGSLYCMLYRGYYITSREAKQEEEERKSERAEKSGKTINSWSFWWIKLEIEWIWISSFQQRIKPLQSTALHYYSFLGEIFVLCGFVGLVFLDSMQSHINVDYGTFENRNESFRCSTDAKIFFVFEMKGPTGMDIKIVEKLFYLCKINWQRHTNLALKLILRSLE